MESIDRYANPSEEGSSSIISSSSLLHRSYSPLFSVAFPSRFLSRRSLVSISISHFFYISLISSSLHSRIVSSDRLEIVLYFIGLTTSKVRAHFALKPDDVFHDRKP